MASIKAEKPVGSKPAGQAKKEPAKAAVSKHVSPPVPKAAVSTPSLSTAPQPPAGSTPVPITAPQAPPSPPVPTTAPKAAVTRIARAPNRVEQKPQEPKKKVTGTKPTPAKKI